MNRFAIRTIGTALRGVVASRNAAFGVRHISRSCSAFSSAAANTTAEPVDPKIKDIVDRIAVLNLLEVSSLVKSLKSTLNIQDVAMPVAAAAATPAAGGAAAAAEEAAPKKEEKTEFVVTLEKVDASSKAKIIKEIKSLVAGINLMEAKKFVESAPKVIKENVSKDDAEKMKKALEALGAKVSLS